MACDADDLPVEITRDADSLIAALRTGGWNVVAFRHNARVMGNWYVDLACEGRFLRLMRDRSQFSISGPSVEELKSAGLWRVFDDFADFRHAVVSWAANKPQV